MTDAEKHTPEFNQTGENYGEKEEEIKGERRKRTENTEEKNWKKPCRMGMTEGTFEIEVTVEYPDGTSEDTTV